MQEAYLSAWVGFLAESARRKCAEQAELLGRSSRSGKCRRDYGRGFSAEQSGAVSSLRSSFGYKYGSYFVQEMRPISTNF